MLARQNHIFEEQPEGGLDQMRRINVCLDEILAGTRKRFPGDAREVCRGLSQAILALHGAEVAAATALADCMV